MSEKTFIVHGTVYKEFPVDATTVKEAFSLARTLESEIVIDYITDEDEEEFEFIGPCELCDEPILLDENYVDATDGGYFCMNCVNRKEI